MPGNTEAERLGSTARATFTGSIEGMQRRKTEWRQRCWARGLQKEALPGN